MAIIPFTLAALKSELTLDPAAIGYNSNNDVTNQNWLALKSKINAVKQTIDVPRIDIAPSEVLEAIDIRDLTVPGSVTQPTLACSWLESLTQMPTVRVQKDDGTDTTVLKNLKLLLVGAGQGSQARLTALSTRKGSRAEQLFGTGFTVSEPNVADALSS
jgi:hypothetical protein